MDFISDALANGRRIKVLTIVDDFTKESIDLVAEHGISGQYVVRVLERAAQFRGLPLAIRTRSGTGVHQQGAGSVGLSEWCSAQIDRGG
jgi:putative transposase